MKENIITYAIIFNGRSRGTLLRQYLTSTQAAGTPREYGKETENFFDFLANCRRNNVQGFLIKFNLLHRIAHFLDADVKYIYLQRENKIKQAISALKAKKNDYSNGPEVPNDSPFSLERTDFQYIESMVSHYTHAEIYARDFFSEKGITPFQIFYKHLATHEDRCKKIVEILNFLGIPPESMNPPKSNLVSQHTVWNDEVYRMYKEYLREKGETNE